MHGIAKIYGSRRATVALGIAFATSLVFSSPLRAADPALQVVSVAAKTQTQFGESPPAFPPVYIQAVPFPLRIVPVSSRLLYWSRQLSIRPASYRFGLPLSRFATTNLWLAPDSDAASEPNPAAGMIFFPLAPPVLGSPITEANTVATPGTMVPASLAFIANDAFYQALITRVSANQITSEQRQAVYLFTKLKSELKTELILLAESLSNVSAEQRAKLIENAQRSQTDRLRDLETQAEKLRAELSTGLAWRNASAAASGEAPKAGTPGWRTFIDVSALQPGLSPSQRRFLREIAFQVSTSPLASSAADTPLLFTPEASRVPLPASLPAKLAAQVAAYVNLKDSLKTELAEFVRVLVGVPNEAKALELCQALAARQAERFKTVEEAAEAIRSELSRLPGDTTLSSRFAKVPFSRDLELKLAAYRQEKSELQHALLERITEVTKELRIGTAAAKLGSSDRMNRIETLTRSVITQFTKEHAARYEALDKSQKEIRELYAQMAPHPAKAPEGVAADVLARSFNASLQQVIVLQHYRLYELAALEPGFSPEQRRLLLNLAMQKLAQPIRSE